MFGGGEGGGAENTRHPPHQVEPNTLDKRLLLDLPARETANRAEHLLWEHAGLKPVLRDHVLHRLHAFDVLNLPKRCLPANRSHALLQLLDEW